MKAGKFFMFGFDGKRPSRFILNLIREEGLGGVILFRRNIESAAQLKGLTSELMDAAGGKLLIGIDQEGGRVSNLPKEIMSVPPMREIGSDYLKNGSTERAYLLGRELGEKLVQLGINIDFAPVMDVYSNSNNKVIGDRAISDDPCIVALLGCEIARGMKDAGLIACGKHFPGHGGTDDDSHLTLPKIKIDRYAMDKVELVPFKAAIENKIPSLMSAHVVYEGIDPASPATLSKKILDDILRKELGFEGLLFSDDLEMRAISDNYEIGTAAVRAISAGCNILLICRTPALQKEALTAVRRATDDGTLKW